MMDSLLQEKMRELEARLAMHERKIHELETAIKFVHSRGWGKIHRPALLTPPKRVDIAGLITFGTLTAFWACLSIFMLLELRKDFSRGIAPLVLTFALTTFSAFVFYRLWGYYKAR